MKICTFGKCPCCQSGDDIIAIESRLKNDVGFYCYGCGSVWLDLPADLDKLISLKKFAPHGARVLTPKETKKRLGGVFKVHEEAMDEKQLLKL